MELIIIAKQKTWTPGGHGDVISQEIATATHGAERLRVHISTISPGGGAVVERHPDSEQVFLIMSGELTFFDGEGNEFVAGPNMAVFMPVNDPHGTANRGNDNVVVLVVTAPPID